MTEQNRPLTRAERDLPALTVLALLTVGPRHPYDIHRFVVETRKDFVTGAPRSIYHAVQRLEAAHLIEPIGSEQAGGRPERTVFALTEAGRAEARRRVFALLSTPQADRTVTVAALSFLGILARDDAVVALHARVAALDAAIALAASDLAGGGRCPADPAHRGGVRPASARRRARVVRRHRRAPGFR
ncbi:PadR family transcriptional regulator [Microbacterium sp. KUDC0406]|uniref:PadR family transcriptional regulator n=1 Tax=Microbacterium sp. KUDC0406 TaxID=2909588 RepID=UPI001F1D5213|nr:PadR family transcriptional regulator [Microbacterium sp. KUDC0406]UJP10400.1 PadR family transcriptional regulator [Microbacterium sp. KUDC0406]